MLKRWFFFLPAIFPVIGFAAMPITFTSSAQQRTLLELYTSEGCSSCPPADRWFSRLKTDPGLWIEIIPVAFHVDYWDHLGWKDKFSRPENTQRQQRYAHWNNKRTIYTPGIMRNGREWRGWNQGRNPKYSGGKNIGELTVTVFENNVTASFRPMIKITSPVTLNISWLGFDLETEIQAGENEGKKLIHDFVSINTDTRKGVADNNVYSWKFKANLTGLPAKRGGAFWVTSGEDPAPIQATGGWLNKGDR